MITLALLSTLLAAENPAPPKPRVAATYSLVLKVGNRDAAADSAVSEAEKRGGYFLERSNDSLVLKVPVNAAKEVLAAVVKLGTVVDKKSEAKDLGDTIDEERTRLKSREDELKRYYAVLGSANVSAVVEVEHAMTGLVQEIESLKGALTLQEHQLRYADVRIAFQFRERMLPPNEGRSSFKWLNTVNLADLMGEFGHE